MRAFLALACVLGIPAVAFAQPDDDDVPLPGDATLDIEADADRTYDGRVWADIGFYSGDETPETDLEVPETSVIVLAPTFGGYYRLPTIPLAFEARLGLVTGFISTEGADSESTARLSNPLLAVYWADRFGRVDVRAGLGFALPLASTRDSASGLITDFTTYGIIAGANGSWDIYQWVPDHFSLLVPVALEARVDRHLVLGAEAGFHFLFSTSDDEDGAALSSNDSDTVFQIGAEMAYRSRSTRAGFWLRYVDVLSADGEADSNQVSFEPYLRFDIAPAFFRLALTMNLDRPNGFSFESGPGRLWCLHLGGGTQF